MVQFRKCVSESRTTVLVQRFALFVGYRCYEGHWPGGRLHQHLTGRCEGTRRRGASAVGPLEPRGHSAG